MRMLASTIAIVALGSALAACAGNQHAEMPMMDASEPEMSMPDMPMQKESMAEMPAMASDMFDPSSLDFMGTFTKTATKPYRSKTHAQGNVYVMPWVNGVGMDAYKMQSNPLPVGTVIVKEHFPVMEMGPSETANAYLVMKKMDEGYDSEHGDWYYAMVSTMMGMRETKASGKVEMCIGCHMEASQTDYVFGVPDSVRAY